MGWVLGLGDADVRDVIRVDVVVVIAEDLRHGVHVDLGLVTGVDDAESEVLGVRVVALEERHVRDVWSPEDGEE